MTAPADLYKRAVALWGVQAQVLMLAEECAECGVAALHLLRGRAAPQRLAEEMADVSIMVDQILYALGLEQAFHDALAAKLRRLEQRLDDEERPK